MSRFADPHAVYLEKLGLLAPKITTEAMEFGNILQDPIARAWAKRDKQKVIPAGQWTYWRDDLPFPMATHLDYLTPSGEIVEIKNASHFAGADFGEEGSDEVPDDYRLQVIHQMSVLDAPRAHLVALIGGNKLRHYLIERDPDTEADLIEIERLAWEGVQSRTPPEIDGSEGATAYLRISQPSDDGTVIEADEELQELATEYLAISASLSAAEQQKAEIANKIKDRLKTVAVAEGGGFKVSYKQSKDTEKVLHHGVYYDLVHEAGLDQPVLDALIAKHTETKPGPRPLLVTYKGA